MIVRLATRFVLLLSVAGCHRAFAHSTVTTHNEVAVTGAPTLTVTSEGGSIQVLPGAEGKVLVEARRKAATDEAAQKLDVQVTAQGNAVRIAYKGSGHNGSFRDLRMGIAHGGEEVDFVIHTPASTKATLSTDGGSIQIEGLGGGIDAKTDGGSVNLKRVKGLVKVHTDGGSIHAAEVEGTLDATTDGGSINVQGKLAGANRIHTDGGSIRVAIPADSKLRVEASTDGGSAANDFGLPVQGHGEARFGGTVGDGTQGTLKMDTDGGSIALNRNSP